MSFNRLRNDACEININNKESAGPGSYQMSTPILCDSTYQDNPQIINQKGGVSMNANTEWRFYDGPVDVETDLLNINRPATNCPDGKYMNEKRPELINMPDSHFPVENTRLSNPPSTLRGTGWNRFETLCLDPQANIFFPGNRNILTHTVFKDNYRRCMRTPKVNSMHPQDN